MLAECFFYFKLLMETTKLFTNRVMSGSFLLMWPQCARILPLTHPDTEGAKCSTDATGRLPANQKNYFATYLAGSYAKKVGKNRG